MSNRRQQFPYSVYNTVSGVLNAAPAGLAGGEGFIVANPATTDPTDPFYQREDMLAIWNGDNTTWDFYPPIQYWPVAVSDGGQHGLGVGDQTIIVFRNTIGWVQNPLVTRIARASVYSIRIGERYYVEDRVNFLHNGFTNDGDLTNDGAVVEVN